MDSKRTDSLVFIKKTYTSAFIFYSLAISFSVCIDTLFLLLKTFFLTFCHQWLFPFIWLLFKFFSSTAILFSFIFLISFSFYFFIIVLSPCLSYSQYSVAKGGFSVFSTLRQQHLIFSLLLPTQQSLNN